MPARFNEVIPGVLYRGGAPEPWEVPILKKHFGINHIISLDRKRGEIIHNAASDSDIYQDIIPVDPTDDNDKNTKLIEQKGATSLVGDKTTYVHCLHGKDRTGMFVGRYRTEHGMLPKEALAEAVKFGFGIGLDDEIIQKYIDVINNGNPTATQASIKDYKHFLFSHLNQVECTGCGMIKLAKEDCPNCIKNSIAIKTVAYLTEIDEKMKKDKSKDKKSNIVDEIRYPAEFNPGDTTEPVDFSIPENQAAQKDFPKIMRKYMIEAIREKLQKYSQSKYQITQPISEEEIKYAKALVSALSKFVELLDLFIKKPINDLIDPIENYSGMTPEAIEEVGAKKYFISYAGNIKKSIDLLTGNLEDIDTVVQKNTGREVSDKKTNENSIFNICIKFFTKFSNDTYLEPMKKSFDDAVKGLRDLIIDMKNYVDENVESPKFQENMTNILKGIQAQIATINTLIENRIIYSIKKDILGESGSSNIDIDTGSALSKIVSK